VFICSLETANNQMRWKEGVALALALALAKRILQTLFIFAAVLISRMPQTDRRAVSKRAEILLFLIIFGLLTGL